MPGKPIGLIAAMPEEIAPLLKRFDNVSKENAGIFPFYRGRCLGREVTLIRSGIGPVNAANATAALINLERPEFIINFGFAGGVLPGLMPGELVIAERVMLQRERLFSEQSGLDMKLAEKTRELLKGELHPATFITTTGVKSKKELAVYLPEGTTSPVIEMETAAVLKVALREGVPLLALRGISDDAAEELGFTVEEFTGPGMLDIRLYKVIWTICRKPWLIPQLMRLAGNSGKASQAMAAAICTIIDKADTSLSVP